jgi:hypothetical protein
MGADCISPARNLYFFRHVPSGVSASVCSEHFFQSIEVLKVCCSGFLIERFKYTFDSRIGNEGVIDFGLLIYLVLVCSAVE